MGKHLSGSLPMRKAAGEHFLKKAAVLEFTDGSLKTATLLIDCFGLKSAFGSPRLPPFCAECYDAMFHVPH